MTLDVYLSVFTLMFISLGINVLALKTRLPYTVLLVIAGSFLVPLSKIEAFTFVTSFQLTPELLFFVFLPVLIFESAYNMNLRNIKENKITISILATIGLLISTFFIGFAGHWVFQLLGLEIPLLVTLLFGAIISATDPVAVLSLFKECGVPQRLTLIFEGESLFNDGTAFAIFLVFLGIMTDGYEGYPTILEGIFSFCIMILGGILFGLFMGFFFSKLIEWVRGHEHLEITLTLLVAHLTFLLAELISKEWVIDGHPIHLSSIIATLVSSMVMGNYGRFKMSTGVENYMSRFWEYFAFLANSLVFLLMGILFTTLIFSLDIAILPILMIILVVVLARAVSVYLSIALANQFKSEANIQPNWQHLLSWGSLRGSLAVIMALLIPDSLTLSGWSYPFTIKEFIIAITIGSIYFTLLIKAPTIELMVRWLKIDALLPHEQLGYYKSKALIYRKLTARIKDLYQHNHLNTAQYQAFTDDYQERYQTVGEQCRGLSLDSTHVQDNMLRIYTLAQQKIELKELFRRNEITESIYRINLNILETQTERVERDQPKITSLNEYLTTWFGKVMNNRTIRRILFLSPNLNDPQQIYLYYQTQYKLISKILDELATLENSSLADAFDDPKAVQDVIAIYQGLIRKTVQQMQHELSSNKELLDDLNEQSTIAELKTVQNDTLQELQEKEIISNKLYILLNRELND